MNKKEHKNGACSPDSPENDTDFTLTPGTEAKYSKIDEAFQLMMQKNQMVANNRVSSNIYYSTLGQIEAYSWEGLK